MDPADTTDSPTAALLSAHAHDLRNQLATLRSVGQLLDDEEIRTALVEATSSLQTFVERGVVSARVERGELPQLEPIGLIRLVQLAAARARREGLAGVVSVPDERGDDLIAVRGPWAERLLADLLHLAAVPELHVAGGPSVGTWQVSCVLDPARVERWVPYLLRVADASGCELAITGDSAAVTMSAA